ncbi:uncharacterized protein LOC131166072 isoform X2 [Malania oleifera]|uniref:uncharacterized protein LOC131166072 isoform X2 n=1 Tax=Malania oleifera TaxID=397392 RepID=UPI0025AE5471|nr:uncharacterized protein LOC131166072 isoform X2 [Malania oleifera]
MAGEGEGPETPLMPKQVPSPKDDARIVSQTSSSLPRSENDASPSTKKPVSPKEFILSVATKISSQPLQSSDPDVWGVLTAISSNARKRHQGINMLLTADEHCIGRLVDDMRFQIESNAISAYHCKIYRKRVATEDVEHLSNLYTSAFLKDTSSTNGTYLNWGKLKKNSSEAKLQHGDIISFAAPPQHELAFAFVYREVIKSMSSADGAVLKRKAEDFGSENKRIKGIGIGAPEGPISLDDFRSLQRSNMELRKQLENQVLTIDTMRNENRMAVERHENELKELKDSITKSYLDQLKELNDLLEVKQNEVVELNRISAEQKHSLHDLNERLSASMQSCIEANEIMNSQKASISELKAQLDEERDQRREEREKAEADLKAAIHRVQSEAQEELKRLSDAALRREREQQEVIYKLQELEKERCLLVETLRSKLEDMRQKLVISDNKVHQLETQVCEEQQASASGRKRVEELEHEVKRLRKELDSEKAAREEAWAKVSALELEINAALRDLDFERRRLKGARERIMLRETQLRAFYSTTEEISVLFAKQQEQLKSMQRTLEDEENYENTSVDIDVNPNNVIKGAPVRDREVSGYQSNGTAKADSATSAQRFVRDQIETSSNGASVTEKHECGFRSQEEGQNTQEVEFTSTDNLVKGGFGSDIDGIGTAPALDGDLFGTEQVLETESPGINSVRNIDMNKHSASAGDTMQLDDEAHVNETEEQGRIICGESSHPSQLNNPIETLKALDDTEGGGTIKTADLLASEVVGSWACSTAPSVHGENETPRSKNDGEGGATLHDCNGQAAESQSTPSSKAVATRLNQERQALSEMIGIVAPDLKEQFVGAVGDGCDEWTEKKSSSSDSDTEGDTDNDNSNAVTAEGGSMSDADTEDCDQADGDQNPDDAMDEDDEATQEDSIG